MLVKLTDIKGKNYWINPLHVKGLTEGKDGNTEIAIAMQFGAMSGVTGLKIPMKAQDVADQISAAMVYLPVSAAPIATDEESPGGADVAITG